MMMRARVPSGILIGVFIVITGCATAPEAPRTPIPDIRFGQTVGQPILDHAVSPEASSALSFAAHCNFEHESGYTVSLDTQVEASEVRALRFSAHVPEHGQCLFHLAGLQQTLRQPQIELTGQEGCVVQLWDQGEKITLAFQNCAAHCTGDAQDYLWPVLIDHQTGQCE